MENLEINELQQLKATLVQKVYKLKNQLEVNREQLSLPADENNFNDASSYKNLTNQNEKKIQKQAYYTKEKTTLGEVSSYVNNVSFDNVSKDWLNNQIYIYNATVITKAIRFLLSITIDLKDDPNYEVLNISSHFEDIERCFILEILPWTNSLAKTKNFSLFMSAVSNYSEYSILRNRILNSLQETNYIFYQQYEKGNGGLIVKVKSLNYIDNIYLKFQWSMKFFDQTCHIEHNFEIRATEFGEEFAQKNKTLLKKFCRIGLKERDLSNLWSDLCNAVDIYEGRGTC